MSRARSAAASARGAGTTAAAACCFLPLPFGRPPFGLGGSVGGSGDPAKASAQEQTYRAQLLYKRSGAGQWPHCGKNL